MEWVMCLACGEFAKAVPDDGEIVPLREECPSCGGTEFKHNRSETVFRFDE